MLRDADIVATAKELRSMVRKTAGLDTDWDKADAGMKAWYIMLAKRAEGLEEKLQ